jgi:hypothetical protein
MKISTIAYWYSGYVETKMCDSARNITAVIPLPGYDTEPFPRTVAPTCSAARSAI